MKNDDGEYDDHDDHDRKEDQIFSTSTMHPHYFNSEIDLVGN